MLDLNVVNTGDTTGDLNLLGLLSKIPLPSPSQLVLRGINTLLATEPWALNNIQSYADKVLCVKVANWQWCVRLQADGLLALADADTPAQCTITLPLNRLADLPKLAPNEIANVLHIEGEAGMAQMLSQLATQLKPDLESDLGRRFGPLIGGALYRFLMALRAFTQEMGQKGMHYLVQDSGLWARREEHERLAIAVDEVNSRLDRLDRLSVGGERT